MSQKQAKKRRREQRERAQQEMALQNCTTDGSATGRENKMPKHPISQIPKQLANQADVAEKWLSEQQFNKEDLFYRPNDIFQYARDFSRRLAETEALGEETVSEWKMEWKIAYHASKELAEMLTAALSELTQERFTSTLILLRPAQELALTVWYAAQEEKLVEWYQYSIQRDIQDYQKINTMMEATLKPDQEFTADPEMLNQGIAKNNARIQELQNLEASLGNPWSEEEWGKFKKTWEPGSEIFSERLEGLEQKALPDRIQKNSWLVLNGYIHARSREFSPPPKLESIIEHLGWTIENINLANKAITENLTPK